MKRILLYLVPVFIFINHAIAQKEHEVKISPDIEAVTVYLNGAEIKQKMDIQLNKGVNRVILQDLSPYLQVQSVQVSVDGSVEIQSVSTQTNYLNPEKLDPRIKRVKDSVTLFNSKITLTNNEIDAYNTEKAVLNENKNIGNKQTTTAVADIGKAAEFYRQKTLEIDNALSKLTEELTVLNNQLRLLQNQLLELNYRNNPERAEVVVIINADDDKTITMHLRYTVINAGWEPVYDLIATDITSPIQLKYRAKVFNNTAVDWDDVPLTLSTADPSQSASRPYLSTWALKYTTYDEETTEEDISKDGYLNTVNVGKFEQQMDTLRKGTTPVQYKTVAVSELSTSFAIATPYTIPADAKPYQVDIAAYTLDAVYSYITVPKLDNNAFLLAKVSGWEKLNLIDGPMNVYFNNSYVGQSSINTRFVEDTLDLSLGRDNQILVTRTKKEDYGSKKMLGSSRKASYKYEIVVKNNKSTPINIEVQDQLPVSLESDITVETDDISGAMLDTPTGRLQWKANLNPGGSVLYKLAYTVKYPKNKQVPLRTFKTISCPSF